MENVGIDTNFTRIGLADSDLVVKIQKQRHINNCLINFRKIGVNFPKNL